MQKLRLNDEVIILAGKDKGKKGTIKQIYKKQNKVLVEGVNIVKKALKPTQQNPNGGIVEAERAIHLSNVAVVSPKTGKATRVGIQDKDGKRVRIAKTCGTILDK